MSNFTKFDAISSLVGGNISGKTDGKNIIYPDGVTAPTEEAINTELARLEKEFSDNQYQRDRQTEYPSIQECVHAILDDDLDALQAKRASIKTKYPKG